MNSQIENLYKFFGNIQIEALFAITSTILALLIPLAIFMIEANGSAKDGSVLWDKMVIFTQVINVKLTVFGLSCITIPLIFWNYEEARLIIVILFLVGQCLMVKLLNNCYKWIIVKRTNGKDYRNEKRLKYLNKLENPLEINDTWKLIWESEKNRVGINENLLLENFFKKLKSYENSKDKSKMLSIYTPNMKVTYETIEKIENHIYHEMELIVINNSRDIEYKFLMKNFYLQYAEQSIADNILIHQFSERLDQFIESSESDVVKRFLKQVGIEIIDIFKKNFKGENTLEEFFPKNLNFEKNKDDEDKQKFISDLFVNWLIRSKILVDYYDNKDGFFANELLIVMFKNMSPITFTRLINFSNFLQNNEIICDNEEKEKRQLIMYSLKRQNWVGMGRTFEITDDNGVTKIKNLLKKETEWTYEYILKSENLLFEKLQSKNRIERKIIMIEGILTSDHSLEEISKVILENLKDELKEFLEYGNKKNRFKP